MNGLAKKNSPVACWLAGSVSQKVKKRNAPLCTVRGRQNGTMERKISAKSRLAGGKGRRHEKKMKNFERVQKIQRNEK